MSTRQPPHPDRKAHKVAHHAAPEKKLTQKETQWVIIAILMALFLGALDQTIIATALPTIGRHFNDLANLSWLVTAYLLSGTVVTPIYGKLSDIYGRRIIVLSAVSLFIAGAIACALAPTMTTLILARALQGLGGGGLIALAQTIIADVVSPRERGRYSGYIGAVYAASSLGGPVLGGFLTEQVHWTVIFWINVPLGLIAFFATSHALKLVPYQPRKHKLDMPGALLMVGAAVALLFALSMGGRKFDWISAEIGAMLLLSAVLWGLFVWRIVVAAEPFLPLSILGNPIVRCAALAGGWNTGAMMGMTIFTPLYFETVLHLSAGQSGLSLIPMMAGSVISSTTTGRLTARIAHYKRLPLIGLTIAIPAVGSLAIWPTEMPIVLVLLVLTVIGAGLGTLFPIATVALQNAVPRTQIGVATGAGNFFRVLFSALVVAVFGAIVLSGLGGETGSALTSLARSASPQALAHAFQNLFIACALVIAFALAFVIALEERPLRGPPTEALDVPTAPTAPIPDQK